MAAPGETIETVCMVTVYIIISMYHLYAYAAMSLYKESHLAHRLFILIKNNATICFNLMNTFPDNDTKPFENTYYFFYRPPILRMYSYIFILLLI